MRVSTCLLAVSLVGSTVPTVAETVIPVLWTVPTCSHEKLGTVTAEDGQRVHELTVDPRTADYARAFAKLAEAAGAQDANAVVVRGHKATYFTRRGARTRQPVHVQLRGAAVRIQGDAAQCASAEVDPIEFAERARRGEPIKVNSDEAYAD